MEPILQAGALMDVFSTAFLPDREYLHLLAQATQPVIDLGEHWVKQTRRNRTVILSSNGPLNLIIPVRKSDSTSHTPLAEIQVSYSEAWQDKGLKAIRSAYKNSPYYEHYQPEFEALLMQREELLYRYNQGLLEWLMQQFYIDKKVGYSTTYLEKGITHDYRMQDLRPFTAPAELLSYKQVFSFRLGFTDGVSALDLLFNKGPEALPFLGIKKEA